MNVGDLVKMKWTTHAAMRRAAQLGKPVNEPGFVVEEFNDAIKVVFPSDGDKVHTLLKENVELISERG